MATTTELIEKLIQLALHNPNREESASAALKVITLIDQYKIPIGADVTIIRDVTENWKPPTKDEMETVDELLKGKKPSERHDYKAGPGSQAGLTQQDHTPMTGQDAFRQRLVDAWRALREERKRLEYQIYLWEQQTHLKYQREE